MAIAVQTEQSRLSSSIGIEIADTVNVIVARMAPTAEPTSRKGSESGEKSVRSTSSRTVWRGAPKNSAKISSAMRVQNRFSTISTSPM